MPNTENVATNPPITPNEGAIVGRLPFPGLPVQFTPLGADNQLGAIVTNVNPEDSTLLHLIVFGVTGTFHEFNVRQATDNIPSSGAWNFLPSVYAAPKGSVQA